MPRKNDGPNVGTVHQLPTGKWRAQFRHMGEQVRRNFTTKREAEAWLATAYADRTRGTYVDARHGRILLRDYAEAWRTDQVHRLSSANRTESMLRRHVYPFLGDRQMGAVRPGHVQAWVRWMLTERTVDFGKGPAVLPPLAPSTAANLHGVVAGMFADAVRNKVVPESPCVGTKLPDAEGGEVVPLTTEQVSAVYSALRATHPHYAATVILAAGTGLRVSEVLGLTKDRVDFLRRTVRVDRQLKDVQGESRHYLGPPKTKASNRTVPLPDVVGDVLAAHMKDHPPVEVTMPVGGARHPEAAVALVFGFRGRCARRTTFADAFRTAADSVAIADGFHGLRHHYASLLIEAGESPKVIQRRLGHATIAETFDTYGHLFPDSEDKTRQAVDAAWRKMLGAEPERSEEGCD